MTGSITLIFPHQLFKNHPGLQRERQVYMLEEWLFFRQYNFHYHKLVLHRASMRFYKAWLESENYKVNYIETSQKQNDCRELIKYLSKENIDSIHIADPADDWLAQRINEACKKEDITLTIHKSPNFLNTLESTADYFNKKRTYFQTDFYISQRKDRKILLEGNSQPVGGKWSFDSDNRKKFPKKAIVPQLPQTNENSYVTEAKTYINKLFPNAYGSKNNTALFVTSFEEAELWLDTFLKERFAEFGIYEDAIVAGEHVLHHSVLTPMLNIGLLNPQQIVEKAINAAIEYEIPLNSLEGFIRQIIGWREFMHLLYEREGRKLRTKNFWKFKRKIPESFWKGETGITPVDITIKKLLQTGYCHHIERLMVLGNFMLLCEFDPDEVYRWFMELFIDSYDWVMVPNVYGMSQFADGGLMTTKPYISGSNYLMKMSDYPKGEWQTVWDGLFWRFMHVHRSFFLSNPRLGMLINSFDKMDKSKRDAHLRNAEDFLIQLDEQS